MDNALKGILLAAGVVITCVVIGVAFYYSRETRNISSVASGDLIDMTEEFDDSQKIIFDGSKVTGSEVINQIDKYSTDDTTVIRVIHKNNAIDLYGNSGIAYCKDSEDAASGVETIISSVSDFTYDRIQDSDSETYINGDARFTGSVQRNTHGVITMITFLQDGANKNLSYAATTDPISASVGP